MTTDEAVDVLVELVDQLDGCGLILDDPELVREATRNMAEWMLPAEWITTKEVDGE